MTTAHGRLRPLFRWLGTSLLGLALAGCATTPADVRRAAAPGDDAAALRVAPAVYSPNAAVRAAALQELLKMKTSQTAADVLLSATLSPNPVIRGDAGAVLVFHPHPDLDFYSITLVADRDPRVRQRMAEGLAVAGRAGPAEQTRRASVYLWGLLQDDDPGVRAAAVQGLGALGLNDPITFSLEALANDPDPRVRAAAARGLGALARAYLVGEAGPDWRDPEVARYVASLANLTPVTPTRARGEEIVAALCAAARTDTGHYTEVMVNDYWLSRTRVEETRFVAIAAANALTVPGRAPRADVAAAQAAAQARFPAPPAPAPHRLPVRIPNWQASRA